jgi:hypothetical protein
MGIMNKSGIVASAFCPSANNFIMRAMRLRRTIMTNNRTAVIIVAIIE